MNEISPEAHALRGTRATRAKESTAICGRPRMPKTLTGIAAEKWRELVRLLAARGTLTKLDGPLLELTCITYERWQALLADIKTHGEMMDQVWIGKDGAEFSKRVANPASKLVTPLQNSYHALLRQLGATPASREHAKPAKAEPKKRAKTPEELEAEQFEELLSRKRS